MLTKNKIRTIISSILVVIILIGFVVYIIFFNINDMFQPSLGIPLVSENWEGYVAATSLFLPQSSVTQVGASWVIPTVQGTNGDAYSSAWVGIGGMFDHSLIQVGSDHDFVAGSPKYLIWYEMLPNYRVPITTMTISPGDQIQASIELIDSTTNTWSISINDQTTGSSFQKNFQYTSSRLSAEWIVEAPQISGQLSNLANFGTINFTNCQATISGKIASITGFAHDTVIMQPIMKDNQNIQLTSISPLTDDGKRFSVNY